LSEVLALSPGQIEIWKEHLRRNPPGDYILHQLIAMIGFMFDSWCNGENARQDRWFFWLNDLSPKKQQPKITDGTSEEDLDLGRRALLDSMGIDADARRQHTHSQC